MPEVEINGRQWEAALDIAQYLLRKVNGRGDAVAVLSMALAFHATCTKRGLDSVKQIEGLVAMLEEEGLE